MSVKKALNEIEGIVKRTTDLLLEFISQTGRAGAELRYQVGDMQARINEYVRDGSFAKRILVCFQLATAAGISVDWMDRVLQSLLDEEPTDLSAVLVVQNMLLIALAQDGRILGKTTFNCRQDVEDMLVRMRDWFNQCRELAGLQNSNDTYQAMTLLGGAVTRYLADVARPLPRMVEFEVAPMPSLAVSQFIYHVGDRAEEIVAENKIVHPAFCPHEIVGLSS